MKTAIIGAGVIGLCTAHYLNKAGHEITVFEREESPGMVTSLGNGGCFSYTMPTVWNAPGSLKMFLSSLLSPETAPIRFKLSALPGMVPWGAKFLKYANETDFVRLTQKNQRLAAYSKNSLESLLDETSIDCAYVDRGFLEIFEDEAALKTHGQMARQLAPDPDTVKMLDASETIEVCAGRQRQHVGLCAVIEPKPVEHPVIGTDAQHLCCRFAFQLQHVGQIGLQLDGSGLHFGKEAFLA